MRLTINCCLINYLSALSDAISELIIIHQTQGYKWLKVFSSVSRLMTDRCNGGVS